MLIAFVLLILLLAFVLPPAVTATALLFDVPLVYIALPELAYGTRVNPDAVAWPWVPRLDGL